jgi:hypothetical protein
VRPRSPRLDLLEHEQFRPVQVPDDRHRGRDAHRGRVQRREVVQVQDRRRARAGIAQRPGPGVDLARVGGVVEGGEDDVGGARPVLVGRMHRRRRCGRIERIARGERRVEVDDVHVEAGIETARIGMLAEIAARARQHRDLPAVRRQLARERARDVGGASAREELQGADDTTGHVGRVPAAARPGVRLGR